MDIEEATVEFRHPCIDRALASSAGGEQSAQARRETKVEITVGDDWWSMSKQRVFLGSKSSVGELVDDSSPVLEVAGLKSQIRVELLPSYCCQFSGIHFTELPLRSHR